MEAVVKGNFVGVRRGKKKDGTPFVFTTVVTGDESVQIFGYDPGDGVKKFAPLEIHCDIQHGEKRNFVTPIKA